MGQEVFAVDFFLKALIDAIDEHVPQEPNRARTWPGSRLLA
jgi:hypothetical protein